MNNINIAVHVKLKIYIGVQDVNTFVLKQLYWILGVAELTSLSCGIHMYVNSIVNGCCVSLSG